MNLSTDKQLQEIDAATLKQLLDRQQVRLIDVREPAEYAGEHIAGAELMPLSSFDPRKIPFEQNQRVVLQCQSGNRSSQAARQVLNAGFPQITHLNGGISAWKAAGYPTIVNKKAPISLMRQVQIVAGSLVLTGTLLGAFVSPWFLILSGFVGAGLLFAGISNTCMLARLLAKLPYNQRI
ncbi:rhodanese-like domain-containing protein [Phormidium sp. CCY1219]|uniref:rhodanese-like domain-containing protein n=1 Tax=Phormidium sp. CCY1219 TaxID=2886104 RepID=UPI002D1E91E9|nr:rhodanese-like domain-containing protein [Phormidium sp. CCY1219]MEB3830798.1 rhodanese-like domain-containing protein [Phormidium sp. CCY1219]